MTREEILKLIEEGLISFEEAKKLLMKADDPKIKVEKEAKEEVKEKTKEDVKVDKEVFINIRKDEKIIESSLENLDKIVNDTVSKVLGKVAVKKDDGKVCVAVDARGIKEDVDKIREDINEKIQEVSEKIVDKCQGTEKAFNNFKEAFKGKVFSKGFNINKNVDSKYQDIIGLAPFASSSKIKDLVLNAIIEDQKDFKVSSISALFAFLESNDQEEIVDLLLDKDLIKLSDFVSLAPFLTEDFLLKCVLKVSKENVDVSTIAKIAPFLSEGVVDDIIDKILAKE